MPQDSLELLHAAAVPAGRRFVRERLSSWGATLLADDAALAATELLSNALQHGTPPVRLMVRMDDDERGVRLEVYDHSTVLPVRPRPNAASMTGRGLAMVDALAERWGAVADGAGKTVWADLTEDSVRQAEPSDVDVDALLASLSDEDEDEDEDETPSASSDRYRIALGDVPTDLLLSAKAHIDNVTREFSLAAAGAATGMSPRLPRHLIAVVDALVNDFLEARQSIKRQALAAAAQGHERTSLTLILPASAADAGERYLAALDEIDHYARSARLLTLETPPRQRAFRTWYVCSLVAALRSRAAGEPASPPVSFESYLLGEIDHLSALQRASERSARLQRATAALAMVSTAQQVGEVILQEAVSELGAGRGLLLLPSGGGFVLASSVGFEPEGLAQVVDKLNRVPLPLADAVRRNEAVWIESREERLQRYPDAASLMPDTSALAAVPVALAGHVLAAIGLGFNEARLFEAEERAFLEAMSALAAQALERAELTDGQRHLAQQLERLQQATASIAGSRNVSEVASTVVTEAFAALGADIGTLCLLSDDERTLEMVAVRSVAEDTRAQWASFPVEANLPASEAVRTGRPVVSRSAAERDARWPDLAGLPPHEDHTLVSLPLQVGGTRLGALALTFAGIDAIGSTDERWLLALADVSAQALHRARAVERTEQANRALVEANDKLAFLAEASAELSRSLDHERTLRAVARLAVPRLADWCAVHLRDEDGTVRPVAVAHVDPAKVALAEAVEARWPAPPDAPSGVPNVLRTGVSEVYAEITDAMVEQGAQDAEHLRFLRDVGMSSVLIAPLVARERVLGTITLIAAESGRHYRAADLTMIEDLAHRAALAIDNATLFGQLALARVPAPSQPVSASETASGLDGS